MSITTNVPAANMAGENLADSISGLLLEVDSKSFSVANLTQYGIKIIPSLFDCSSDPRTIQEGTLQGVGDEPFVVQFRVRRSDARFSECAFHQLPLEKQEHIARFLKTRDFKVGKTDAINELSYDQLASGAVKPANEAARPPKAKKNVKSFVAVALVGGIFAVLILAAAFVHLRYSLQVSNAVLFGNCLPINTHVNGEVVEVLVNEGDYVQEGEVLVRLSDPTIESAEAMARSQLETVQTEVAALSTRIEAYSNKSKIVSKKLTHDLAAAKAGVRQLDFSLKIARSQVERFAPFVSTGAVSQIEFDQAQNSAAALDAERQKQMAAILGIELSQRAVDLDILIIGDRIHDELGELKADLAVAQAREKELTKAVFYADKVANQFNIVAPRDGVVFALYRQKGEYLQVADEAVAMTIPGATWAIGQITADQATSVCPGQTVTIDIPSLELKTEGKVVAVGHRAIYAKNAYQNESRGSSITDVPIKVALSSMPDEIPTGTRLDMVIRLGVGIPFIDHFLGGEKTKPKVLAQATSLAR